MADTKQSLKQLVEELRNARREYYHLQFDEESPDELLGPASTKDLATLSRRLGKPLPPSYRAFLELHNGWSNFTGAAKVLATEDQDSAWVKARVKTLSELFFEADNPENPFAAGCIPIVLGEDESDYLVLDPRKARPDGEMTFVLYDYTEKEQSFKDFAEYLRYRLKRTRSLIKRARAGQEDEDSEQA